MVKQNAIEVTDECTHDIIGLDSEGIERIEIYGLNDGRVIAEDSHVFYFFQNNRLMEQKEVEHYLRKLANYRPIDFFYVFAGDGLYRFYNFNAINLGAVFNERIGLCPLQNNDNTGRWIFLGSQASEREQIEDWYSLEEKDFQPDISREKTITSARKEIEDAQGRLKESQELLSLMESIKI